MSEPREIVVRIQLEYPPDRGSAPAVAVSTGQPLLYRVGEVATLLGIGVSRVTEMCTSGAIESVKLGGSRRIPREAVEQYVRQLRGSGDAPAA